MKSVYQMLPQHALSRVAVVNAGKLIQEFDGIILHSLDTKIISEFSLAYKAFMKVMEDRFVSEETVVSTYKKLNATMSNVLSHYVDVSMTCRKFYDALLEFCSAEQDYHRLLPQLHNHLSMDEYTNLVTLYTDLKTHFQECCLPDAESSKLFKDTLTKFMSGLASGEGVTENEQI